MFFINYNTVLFIFLLQTYNEIIETTKVFGEFF